MQMKTHLLRLAVLGLLLIVTLFVTTLSLTAPVRDVAIPTLMQLPSQTAQAVAQVSDASLNATEVQPSLTVALTVPTRAVQPTTTPTLTSETPIMPASLSTAIVSSDIAAIGASTETDIVPESPTLSATARVLGTALPLPTLTPFPTQPHTDAATLVPHVTVEPRQTESEIVPLSGAESFATVTIGCDVTQLINAINT
ncbi:MAG: hypothetical protein IH587_02060, partial [Anaerolineae bacterium]|nr:hypothetical protein [Anaerolineae bacterium]